MKLTLKEVSSISGGATNFKFNADQPLVWKPGQYIHYTLQHNNVDDRGNERWFTISSAPFEQDICISTRINQQRSSSFKQKLINMAIGDTIEADAPEGDFVVADASRDFIFIIGGIGITPIRSILAQANHDGVKLRGELLWANRSEESTPFKEEIEEYARLNPDLVISNYTGDHQIDDNAIKQAAAKLNNPIYYVSGPEPMTEALEARLKAMGVSEDNLKLDFFPGYEIDKG